ncbi:hypothetical protein CR152_20965 [Massilia violaceinigra]|uniref:Type II secretion system protein H n=1 Tax=Massilia violaceinigra TaxID=2045208 RepID=A0A2D2DVL7_9BURK|nr:GspH/FimT family pseudopilin [Massilia violaceinigra]ATQ79029.1 hypothetical protein CR152_20965 [Massilia violaceinigra]
MMLSAKQDRARGFSLTELLITLSIVGVASAIGFPMLTQFAEDGAVSTQSDLVLNALNYTRSEATKRGKRVTMCRSDNGTSCQTLAPGDWRIGWIVFVDDNIGGAIGTVDTGETVLVAQSAFSGRGQAKATGNVIHYVSYTSTGQPRFQEAVSHVGEFYLCGKTVTTKRRKIALTAGTGYVGAAIVAPSSNCVDPS